MNKNWTGSRYYVEVEKKTKEKVEKTKNKFNLLMVA